MELSNRVKRLAPSFALATHFRYRELLRQGKDVVSSGVGEPDFDTPAHIKKAGTEAIDQEWTKYPPISGLLELREAISFLLKKRYGLN